jgi:hypothetical protein
LGYVALAEITAIDGQPAICLPADAKGTFSVGWATVSESYARSPRAWGLALEKGRAPVTMQPGDCLPFGVVPDAYEVEKFDTYEQPLTIEINKAYVFEISSASLSSDVYSVAFLVCKAKEGVRYVKYSAYSIGGRLIPSCGTAGAGDLIL